MVAGVTPTSRGSILAIAVVVAGCVRTAPVPQPGYWVSSDASQYSPVVRFRVVSSIVGSQVRVVIDSGVVSVPGVLTPESPRVMNNLYLTAYVAVANVGPMAKATGDSVQYADRRGWRAVATSDSLPFIDHLRYGEQRPISDIHLTMSTASIPDGPLWLVFRISANVVDLRLRFDPRGALTVGPPGSRVRVYACSDRDLSGQADSVRSNAMRRAYGLLC